MPEDNVFLVEKFALLLSVLTIIAYWTRFFALPPFVFYFLFVIAILHFIQSIWRKKSSSKSDYKFDIRSNTVPLLIALLFSVQMVFLGYTASNDALHSILDSIIQKNGSIPATYAPYSDLAFGYAAGFHSLASYFLFTDAFIINWIFGLIFVFLIVALFINLLNKFVDKKIALLTGLLLLSTKMIFLEFFYGMYPRLFAIAMLLLCIILIKKKRHEWFIPFVVMLLVHPMYAIVGFGWMSLEVLRAKKLSLFLGVLPAIVLVVPAIIQSYSVYFMNFFVDKTGAIEGATQVSNFISITSLILFFGGAIFVVWAILSAIFIAKRKENKRSELAQNKELAQTGLFYFLLFIVFFLAAFLSSKIFTPLNSGFISIGTYIMLICTAVLFQLSEKKIMGAISIFSKRFAWVWVIGVVLLIIISNVGTSSDIQKRIAGSKIYPPMADFAFAFKQFDPNLEKTFFIADSSGKIAEYSNKIPMDIENSFFLPFMNSFGKEQEYKNELAKISAVQLTLEKCKTLHDMESFDTFDATYVVVDSSKYVCKFNWPIVFSHGTYIVYKIK